MASEKKVKLCLDIILHKYPVSILFQKLIDTKKTALKSNRS
jgi:hypothetical protein